MKIRKPPPPGVLNHPVKRYRDGRNDASDSIELKHWMESVPDVPPVKWFKRFKSGTLAGKGDTPSTFLAPEMAVEGTELE